MPRQPPKNVCGRAKHRGGGGGKSPKPKRRGSQGKKSWSIFQNEIYMGISFEEARSCAISQDDKVDFKFIFEAWRRLFLEQVGSTMSTNSRCCARNLRGPKKTTMSGIAPSRFFSRQVYPFTANVLCIILGHFINIYSLWVFRRKYIPPPHHSVLHWRDPHLDEVLLQCCYFFFLVRTTHDLSPTPKM